MRYYTFQNEVKSYLNRLERERSLRISLIEAKSINDRVEALKRSGDWDLYSLGFNDIDADLFLNRANINNLKGCCEIPLLVRGFKKLNLWNDMISWPLRNYLNTGTGSTVYSLGGIGTFNGTLINSPNWETNGINFGSVSQYFLTNFNANQPLTIFSINMIDNNSVVSRLYDSISDHLLYMPANSTTLQASPNLQTVGTIILGNYFSAQIEYNGTSGTVSLNGANKTTRNTGTNNLTGTGLRIGSFSATQIGRRHSFVAIIRKGNINLLHNFCKNIIGEGLNLI